MARAPSASLLALALLAASTLAAQEPLVTDRPDRTESAAVVAPGLVQLEAGWTYAETDEDGLEVRVHAVPEALLRVGLLPWLEARFGFAGWQSRTTEAGGDALNEDGFGDTSVGAKAKLVSGSGGTPAVALLGELSVPTGDDGLGGEAADPSFRLTVDHELPAGFSLGWNAGVAWETVRLEEPALPGTPGEVREETRAEALYTAALGIPVAGALGAFAEAFGSLGLSEERPDRHAVDGGLTLLLAPNVQLDASAGVGIAGEAEDWFAGAGVSLRIPR